MAIYDDIIKEINKKYRTNYQISEAVGEGNFVKVFNLKGYKESADDTHEYVGRFTLRPTTDDKWTWIKNKTRQEQDLLTRKDVKAEYVGKFCKTYSDDSNDPEWFFSIQKKLIPLREYLRKELGKTPTKEKKELIYSKIFAELSEAMCYVHSLDYKNSKGILLRDVKPENIMYDKDVDRCLLCDFNTAREFNIQDYWAGTTMTAGTVDYMAPEIYLIKGGTEKKPSPRQDVYSLGATLFSLVTRKATKEPVPDEDSGYYAQEISDERKLSLLEKTGLSREFRAIIYFAIQRVPQKRYQDADELNLYASMLYRMNKAESDCKIAENEISTLSVQGKSLISQIDTLNEDLKKSKEQVNKSTAKLKETNKELRKKNSKLKYENEKIAIENASLKKENDKLLAQSTRYEQLLEQEKQAEIQNIPVKDNRSENEKELEKFLSRFEDPKDDISSDFIQKKESNKKTAKLQKEPKQEVDEKACVYSAGLFINTFWVLAYLVFNYFTTLPELFERFPSHWAISFFAITMWLPFIFAECFAWPTNVEATKQKFLPSFMRLMFLFGPIIFLVQNYNCLIPRTYISYSMILAAYWSIFILIISFQYCKYLNKAKVDAKFRIMIIVYGIIAILFISAGFIPRCNSLRIGDEITIGSYVQSADEYAEEEPLNWKVCNIIDDVALVATDKCIAYLPLTTENEKDVHWKDCYLRQWLNSLFCNNTFSDAEQALIMNANLSTSLVSESALRQSGVEYSENYVFIDDVQHATFCREIPKVTEYALSKYEADEARKEYPYMWTRSTNASSDDTNSTYFWVLQTGLKKHVPRVQTSEDYALVRPMMYINIKEYKKLKKGENNE